MKNLKAVQMMKMGHKIDEKTAMEKDVKAMSYDDLMAAIRFLDDERQTLSETMYGIAENENKRFVKQEKLDRAA